MNQTNEEMRKDFHSFWNNSLYGDGDTEPVFPSYEEIVIFWLSKLQAREEQFTKDIKMLLDKCPKDNYEYQAGLYDLLGYINKK